MLWVGDGVRFRGSGKGPNRSHIQGIECVLLGLWTQRTIKKPSTWAIFAFGAAACCDGLEIAGAWSSGKTEREGIRIPEKVKCGTDFGRSQEPAQGGGYNEARDQETRKKAGTDQNGRQGRLPLRAGQFPEQKAIVYDGHCSKEFHERTDRLQFPESIFLYCTTVVSNAVTDAERRYMSEGAASEYFYPNQDDFFLASFRAAC